MSSSHEEMVRAHSVWSRGFKAVLILAVAAAAAACGSGGGGGGGTTYDKSGQLLSVTFPDPNDVNAEATDTPPASAPLVQQIVLTFSTRPDPNRISANTLQVRDAANLPVSGSFTVADEVVTFTPTLPLRPYSIAGNGAVDSGGTGLNPGGSYTIRVGARTFSFVTSVASTLLKRFPDSVDARGVLIGFKATTNPANFFAGLKKIPPQLVKADPADGETGVSPNLYSDPDGLFPPRRSFFLTFDRALHPDPTNVGDSAFQLIDLDDRPPFFPSGLPLGIDVTLIENEVARSVVKVTASGILPFGDMLALELPTALMGLSDTGAPSASRIVATRFTIAPAPATTVRDALVENFDTVDRRDADPVLAGLGNLPADWDERNSNVLQAGFAFKGSGVLGSFMPPAPPGSTTRVVTLDTTRQTFPLPDGSTPDAPPGFEVIGGVFSFTDIDIPDRIVVKPIGPNPLVLTATGSVHIAGDVLLAGEDGTPENAYDSGITSIPGGAGIGGGGRGGESHPILFFPPDQISYLTYVDPLYGGTGYGIDAADGVMKRIGGTGGQCGCLDLKDSNGKYQTNQEIDCSEFRGPHSNEKPPGGGGGSMLMKGITPGLFDKVGGNRLGDANGVGNVLPDGAGTYIVRDYAGDSTQDDLLCGVGGTHPFFDDGNAANDFIGTKGQVTRLIGGQGGGGGASLTESYSCGCWCHKDSDPNNDLVCDSPNDDFGCPNPTRAGSVGDARGGGAGAGGGGLLIQALGPITLDATCNIDAAGGRGMGGEALGCSYWGGGGGGGSGGAILLQSGTSILVQSGAILDVTGGPGNKAENDNFYFTCDTGLATGNAGDAGGGSPGMIQLQVPAGLTATVVSSSTSLRPSSAWIDPSNTLNPVEFTPISVAISTWFDLGRVTNRPPATTNPVFSFQGLDAQGFVVTDSAGNVVSPSTTDVVCSYLGQFDPVLKRYKPGEDPRADFIPLNASVKVEFQGANPIVEGSKEVDPATLTNWSPTPSVASGRQFLRWRITLDVTADGSALSPSTRLPIVESIQVDAQF